MISYPPTMLSMLRTIALGSWYDRRASFVLIAWLSLVGLAGCAGPADAARERTDPPPTRPTAFRAEGGAWHARGHSHRVRVAPEGFQVVPLRGQPQGDGTPVTFATERISRGSCGRGVEPAQLTASGDRATLHRGDVIEDLRNTEAGVLLSYSFPRRPQGEGDLLVRLRVSGQAYGGERGGDHVFTDRGAGAGVRVGQATWIDARGVATPVATSPVSGGLELRVPGALMDSSAYPAVLDPLISAEVSLSDPRPGPVAAFRPAIAFGAGQYLVVWEDGRTSERSVWGARSAPDGTVKDPLGIRTIALVRPHLRRCQLPPGVGRS